MSEQRLTAVLEARITDLERNLDKAVRQVQEAEKKIDNSNKNTGDSFGDLGKKIAGVFVADKILDYAMDVGKQMLEITAKFEKYNAVLTNTLGSQQAAAASMSMIKDFAAKTPFAVDELTGSFIKLANAGFLPTEKALTSLGDLASSTGKSFDQLTEAILDAQTGEYERLKEFGIRAQDNGDKVTFTFKGIQTQVEKTSNSIREYITGLGETQGVSGSMAAISATLTGQISNLGDTWDSLLVSFGNNTKGVFSSAIGYLNDFLTAITEANNNLEASNKVGAKTSWWDDYVDRWASIIDGRPSHSQVVGAMVSGDAKSFMNIANEAIKGAKVAGDYNKALGTLAEAYDSESKRLKGSQISLNSIKLAYDSAKAFIEAQRDASQKQGKGNFGKTGKGPKPKEGFALLQSNVSELETALQKSLMAGNADVFDSPLASKLKFAKERLADLKSTFETFTNGSSLSMVGGPNDISLDAPGKLNASVAGQTSDLNAQLSGIGDLSEMTDNLMNASNQTAEWTAYAQKLKDTLTAVKDELGTGLVGVFEQMLTGGQNAFEGLGQLLLKMVSRFVAATLAALALAAVIQLIPGFGSAVGLSGGFTKIFGSLSSSLGGLPIPKLANGGVTTGPTLAWIGEGQENEVVAPLSKFNEMVENRAGQSGGELTGEIRVSGADLIVVLERAKKQKGRIG